MLKGLTMKNRLLATATVGLAFAVTPAAALASDGGITVQDRCDHDSFVAALGDPHACDRPQGDGGGVTTFDELIASLIADRANDHWRFKEEKVALRAGQSLNVTMNRGGEGHTVTEVPSFGPGCVPELNALVFPGQDPTAFPAACGAATTFTPGFLGGDLIAPGLPGFSKVGLSKGTHRFQCMIHPWMKSTVAVR
jgi:plastocyanin